MTPARGPAAVCAALCAALGGCAAPQAAKVVSQVETVKKEEAPDKLLERGRAFAMVGDYTRAEQYFAAALETGADPRVALPLLLKVCVVEQRYRVAIDYAEQWLKKQPDDVRLRFVVASLYATIGETKTAREHYEQVTKAAPKHAEAHYALAVLLRDEESDAVGADTHFRAYLRLKPDGPHAAEARASLLRAVR